MSFEGATVHTFAPMVGSSFRVKWEVTETVVDLNLVSATKSRPDSAGERPFSLTFEGPSQYPFEQQILNLEHSSGVSVEIFLVPISDNGTLRQYQAVFN